MEVIGSHGEVNATVRIYYLHFQREGDKPHHTGPWGYIGMVRRQKTGAKRRHRPWPLLEFLRERQRGPE